MTPRRLRVVTAVLVLAMVGGTAELAREPRLVAFTSAVTAPAALETADTVVPSAPSYLPAAMKSTRQPHAVDAVFHLPSEPAATQPSMAKPVHKQPRSLEAALRAPRMIESQMAEAEPPAMMQLPDSAAASLRAQQVRQQIRQARAVVVFASWTEYVTPDQPDDLVSTREASTTGRTRARMLVAHPVPSYAAIATPDGWLILQL